MSEPILNKLQDEFMKTQNMTKLEATLAGIKAMEREIVELRDNLQATKKELEEVKLDLHIEKEAYNIDIGLLKKAQAERDELKKLATELIKSNPKSFRCAFNNLAEALGLENEKI